MTIYFIPFLYSLSGDEMNAYIDLSYIFHVLVLLTLPYYFKKILNVRMKKMELIGLIIFSIVLYFNVFLFDNYGYINLVFLLAYFLLVYHKKFLKYYLLYLFAYYSNIATCMIFTTNIYLLNGVVLLNTPTSFFYISLELVNIMLIEIILFSIRSIKLLRNYKIKIRIRFKDKFSDFIGYIDSGNTLIVDGLPVIFLKDSYFLKDDYKEMVVNGIGTRKCKYFKTSVIINDMEREVICASGNSKGFKGCDCLINIHLLEEKI